MSTEDTEARAAALANVDSHTPMALEPAAGVHKAVFPESGEKAPASQISDTPPQATAPATPQKRPRRTQEEIAADKAARAMEKGQAKLARAAERAQLKITRAREREQAKLDAKARKLLDAEGGYVELPAVVMRDGTCRHVSGTDAWAVVSTYLPWIMLDVETSGYPLGHQLYELRTVQLGGEDMAVVFDASDPGQLKVASLALGLAEKVSAHSATADVVPCVAAGLIEWDAIWAKMHDSVLYLKLIDPKLSGSDASKLKEVAGDLLGDYAVSPSAEKAKNALFTIMGCLVNTDITTPPEKNGWNCVNRNSVTMTIYAGSDVLDLAAVMRVLPPLPVADFVLERERQFEAQCARISYDGFKLDSPHVKEKIAEHEKGFKETQANVLLLSSGRIDNPKSPEVAKSLIGLFPGITLNVSEKTGNPSAAKAELEKVKAKAKDSDPLLYHLADQILEHRHHSTTLSLLLRPFESLCDYGDGRMRPTIYTINADTGRTSAVRPNIQQLSRKGGIRGCVIADPGFAGVDADFEGCEICVAAALSGDKGLYEAQVSPKCYACGGNPCGCGKEHTGLHWMAAHLTFGPEAVKEHKYECKKVIFRKLFGGAPDSAVAEKVAHVFDTEIAPVYAAWDKWLRKCFYEGKMVWRDYGKGENFSSDIEGKRRLIYKTYSGRHIYANAPHAAGNYCVAPGTLILRDDLQHVPARSIRPGDELVGFDEHRAEGEKYRALRKSVAEKVSTVVKPSVTVTAGGISTTCSSDHLWLTRTLKQPGRGTGRLQWRRAEDLVPGDILLSIGTWDTDESRTGGYLAGLYDGEGSLQARGLGHKATGLYFSQLPGLTMDEFCAGMFKLGLPGKYRKRSESSTTPADSVQVTGIKDIMHVLGTLRPVRLLAKGSGFYAGAKLTGGLLDSLTVESVEDAGELLLVSIQTSTRTFVANGILSHNCIQGTARELLVDGLLDWGRGPWGHLPVAPVHDELLLWVPEADGEAARKFLVECMETSVLSSPGFPVHIGAEPSALFTAWQDSS